MHVRLTLAAECDLAEIILYVANSSPRAASSLLDAFDEVVALISDQPGIGHLRDDIGPFVREWNPSGKLRSYRIFYYVSGDFVVIYQVVHGNRSQLAALRDPYDS